MVHKRLNLRPSTPLRPSGCVNSISAVSSTYFTSSGNSWSGCRNHIGCMWVKLCVGCWAHAAMKRCIRTVESLPPLNDRASCPGSNTSSIRSICRRAFRVFLAILMYPVPAASIRSCRGQRLISSAPISRAESYSCHVFLWYSLNWSTSSRRKIVVLNHLTQRFGGSIAANRRWCMQAADRNRRRTTFMVDCNATSQTATTRINVPDSTRYQLDSL